MPSPLAAHWLLEPTVTFLNHGSFGATPRPVLDAQAAWRDELERGPVRFLNVRLEGLLDDVRGSLGPFVGARPEDLVFVPNATTGVNTVLRSLRLQPGDELLATDHEYNACLNAAGAIATAAGARLVLAAVPFPVPSADAVVDAVLARVTDRTRFALVSHVTSATAVVFPIERVVRELRERGVETIVDGAHAPGMVPLDLHAIGAAAYTGNAHKWLCAPKGAAFLWVRRDLQDAVRPLVISHGANSARRDRGRYRIEFDWIGTADPTAVLAIPEALRFGASLVPGGWPALMVANRKRCLAGRDVVAAALGVSPATPDDMTGSMAALEVPVGVAPPAHDSAVARHSAAADHPALPDDLALPDDPLNAALFHEDGIEVPVVPWPQVPARTPDRARSRILRISAQAYNDAQDYERLAAALRRRRSRVA